MPSAARIAWERSNPSWAISQAPDASDRSVADRITKTSPRRTYRGSVVENCGSGTANCWVIANLPDELKTNRFDRIAGWVSGRQPFRRPYHQLPESQLRGLATIANGPLRAGG